MPDLTKLADLPALQQLARALWHKGSIRGAALMVGAGFSKNALLQAPDTPVPPSWNELLDELVRQLYPTDQSSAPKEALRIAEEYRTYYGQATLDGFIRTRFPDRAWLPGPLHLQALNFPWSDILTTNWDTLLERTSEAVTDFIYEVVRTEADIAHARGPRIIKLHGTLGDKDPLIFAAEDYRTYPTRHAAFINLARQIFIENDLCLLGFSGNDPNFLEWVGWVRDQLGGHARRIYLVGYLDLSVSARRYLEAHNIAPVDFAPLVGHLAKKERHGAATKIFLQALRDEQPPAPHEWRRHELTEYPLSRGGPDVYDKARKDLDFAAAALKESAQLLREDRERYPGWPVCPRQQRHHLQYGYGEWAVFRPSVLARIEPSERAEILIEFLWHYTISFCPLPPLFRDALVAIMEEANPPIENWARLKFAVALMRDARIGENDANLEKWHAIVNADADVEAPERREAEYQRCLRLRDKLDLKELSRSIALLDADDPLWRLRQAGLYTEVGEYIKAAKLIKDATAELEKAHRLDRNSLWIKSCLAWASWLNRVTHMGDFPKRGELPRLREFPEIDVDPAAELESIKNSADDIIRKEQEDDAAIIPLFDAGSYRPGKQRSQAQPGDPGFELLYELDQLMESAGIPMRINHVQIVAGTATSIMKATYHRSTYWYGWLLRTLHSHFDNLYVRYFGRIAIAQLPRSVADDLRDKLNSAIAFWHTRNVASVGEERAKDRSIAIDQLRLALSAQSHMSVRMSEEEAVQAFDLAAQIVQDPPLQRWVIEAAAELAKYALQALPANRQGALALNVVKFPLAAERGGPALGWPDLVSVIANVSPQRDPQDPRWDQRVNELLGAAVPDARGRIEATGRLAYLAMHDALKPNERDSFAAALWDKVDSEPQALPSDTHLLASAVANLPAPAGIDPVTRVKARIFDRDLKEVMDCSGPLNTAVLAERQNHFISLYNTGPLGLAMPPERAAELFDQAVSWESTPINDQDPIGAGFTKSFNESVSRIAGDALTFTIVPAMAREARTEARLQALLQFIRRTQSWRAVAALPEFLETMPQMGNDVTLAIHRGLAAAEHMRVSGAATALIRWSRLIDAGRLTSMPRMLIEQLLSMIETRQEEALHILLNAAVALVKDRMLTGEDVSRLMRSLSDLRDDTQYAEVILSSRRAVSISLVRQQCVRLAKILKQKVADDGTLQGWLEDGQSDPLPEVRFATLDE